MTIRSMIAEAKQDRGVPVPLGVLRKAAMHPGIAMQSAVAAFSYRGGDDRAIRHTEAELRRAKDLPVPSQTPADLSRTISQWQRRLCYHTAHLYAICRAEQPDLVVETGVYFGASSAFILQALADNGHGRLFSVDLPRAFEPGSTSGREPTPQGPGPRETGLTVPHLLRDRWTLVSGDARTELPRLLSRLGAIDLFHHDSNHSYSHMTFELQQAWPALRPGGLLVSDDVLWNSAFLDFAARQNVQAHVAAGVGLARKPEGPKTSSPIPTVPG